MKCICGHTELHHYQEVGYCVYGKCECSKFMEKEECTPTSQPLPVHQVDPETLKLSLLVKLQESMRLYKDDPSSVPPANSLIDSFRLLELIATHVTLPTSSSSVPSETTSTTSTKEQRQESLTPSDRGRLHFFRLLLENSPQSWRVYHQMSSFSLEMSRSELSLHAVVSQSGGVQFYLRPLENASLQSILLLSFESMKTFLSCNWTCEDWQKSLEVVILASPEWTLYYNQAWPKFKRSLGQSALDLLSILRPLASMLGVSASAIDEDTQSVYHSFALAMSRKLNITIGYLSDLKRSADSKVIGQKQKREQF